MKSAASNSFRPSSSPIRVLVADDHPVVRKGIRALLAECEDIELIGEASDGLEAIDQVDQLNPDVILMDLMMPNLDGIEAIRRITTKRPRERILALTSFSQDDKIIAAIKAGAVGYLPKDSTAEELVQAIRQVFRDELSLPPYIARKVLMELSRPKESARRPQMLTERELEVVCLVAQGFENHEIAAELNIAEVTVRTHVNHILDKLQLANRVQIALFAVREGLISVDEVAPMD